jgi:hypothetical protein
MGWLAGVAGILPIDVPAGIDFEVEARIGWLAAVERLGKDHELDVHMRGVGGAGYGAGGQGRKQGQEKSEGEMGTAHRGQREAHGFDALRVRLVA